MGSNSEYKRLLDAEVGRLRKLLERRKKLKTELDNVSGEVSRLREGVIGLAALASIDLKNEQPELFTANVKTDLGLTAAILKALDELQQDFVSPSQIRDYLYLEMEFPIHLHKNPLASIQSVLKRLIDSGQVDVAEDTDTKRTVYAWSKGFAATRARLNEEGEAVGGE